MKKSIQTIILPNAQVLISGVRRIMRDGDAVTLEYTDGTTETASISLPKWAAIHHKPFSIVSEVQSKRKAAPKTETVAARLRAHLGGDGTANDNTTAELYREAHRLPSDQETDLETVERWAFDVFNSEPGGIKNKPANSAP